jgi:hypothetical protein
MPNYRLTLLIARNIAYVCGHNALNNTNNSPTAEQNRDGLKEESLNNRSPHDKQSNDDDMRPNKLRQKQPHSPAGEPKMESLPSTNRKRGKDEKARYVGVLDLLESQTLTPYDHRGDTIPICLEKTLP